ncbi:MAG TPA: hypothetical protein VFF95_08415 [Candidatus Binatus sp.]|jgi:hypothetical protein|nr:hypothetical protein [Candidatus Binatus sp.]
MKRIYAMCLFIVILMPLPTPAVDGGQVMYVGGTVGVLKEGILGRLDATSQTALNFEYSGGRLVIPFGEIDSYEYSQQVARHLGVVPAIAVGLVKRRQRRHYFRITYHDESKTQQVAIFEVSKETPRTLLAILQGRAPQGCRPQPYGKCGVLSN